MASCIEIYMIVQPYWSQVPLDLAHNLGALQCRNELICVVVVSLAISMG